MKRIATTIAIIALVIFTLWWAGERLDASPTWHSHATSDASDPTKGTP